MVKPINKAGHVKKGQYDWIRRTVLCVCIFFLFAMLNTRGIGPWNGLDLYSGTNGYEEKGWTLQHGGVQVAYYADQPGVLSLEQGHTYTLSTVLDYDGRQDSAPYVFFSASHVYCRIFVDDQMIFRFMPEDFPYSAHGRSTGNLYASAPMPENCQGRVFRMEFTPALETDIAFQLPRAFFGDYPTMMHSIFMDDIGHNCVAMVIGFMGLISMFFASFTLKGEKYRKGIFLGIFSLLFSVFSMTESLFVLHLISNPYESYIINQLALGLMPIVTLAHYRENFAPLSKKITTYLIFGEIAVWLLQLSLHLSGVLELQNTLSLTHGLYVLSLAYLLGMLLLKKNSHSKFLIIQILPVIMGLGADLIVRHMHLRITSTNLEFTSFGIVVFILLEVRCIWKSSVQIYSDAESSRYYRNIALVDPLTGIGNRRAFNMVRDSILSGKNGCSSVLVISVDVNDLKITNDTQGHDMGDRLIRMAARVLRELCRDKGRAFRTGGDEFMVLMYDMTDQEFAERRKLMDRHIQSVNDIGMFRLSLALGYEITDPAGLGDAILRADEKMYKNKMEAKAAQGRNGPR